MADLTRIYWDGSTVRAYARRSFHTAAALDPGEVAREAYGWKPPADLPYCCWDGSAVVKRSAAECAAIDAAELEAARDVARAAVRAAALVRLAEADPTAARALANIDAAADQAAIDSVVSTL